MPKRGKLKIYFGYCPHEVLLAAVKETGKYRRGANLDELLAQGIDVVTTLRVSELSSVAETLPESVRVKIRFPTSSFRARTRSCWWMGP